MLPKIKLLLPSLSVCLLMNISAQASGISPFYIGATLGTTINNSDTLANNYCQKENLNCKNEGVTNFPAGQAYAGFHFSENIAVEAGYAYLGNTAKIKSNLTTPKETISPNFSQDTQSVFGAALFRLGLSNDIPLRVYAKGGAQYSMSKVSVEKTETNNGTTTKSTSSFSGTGIGPMFGAGAEFDFSDEFTFRAGWDRFMNTGKEDWYAKSDPTNNKIIYETLKTNVDVFSAGINYYFM